MRKLKTLFIPMIILVMATNSFSWEPSGGWDAFIKSITSGKYAGQFSRIVSTTSTTTGSLIVGVVSHIYTVSEDWVLSAIEKYGLILSTGSGSGSVNIVDVGGVAGTIRVVRNNTSSDNTIKESGQTGVTIATGKTTMVWHDGTDYRRLTADATH